jgi:hypothetical protein
MRNELGQSADHFKRAATIAAKETGATVGTKFYTARDRVQPAAVKARGAASSGWDSALATITPLVAAATETMRQAGKESAEVSRKQAKANRKDAKRLQKRANKAMSRKRSGRRGSKLIGLALLGATVGAGAAFAMRRRQAAQWDEYDPSEPIAPAPVGADDAAFEPADTVTTVSDTTPAVTTEPVTTEPATTEPATSDSATSDSATSEPATSDSVIGDVVTGDIGDQTSSPQHSPKVARMASGQNGSTTQD